MVFHWQCWTCAYTEDIKYEARMQTTTSVDTFHTAAPDFSDSQSATHTIPDPIVKSDLPSNLRVFTLAELKKVTGDFDSSSKIGEGGFGSVYKGVIQSVEEPPREINVAVKRQKDAGFQAHKQWENEVKVLGKVEHPNLVKLLGYCIEDDASGTQRLLVYEYMPYGSLEDCLSGQANVHLSWPRRLKLAIDAACGLAYLHEGMKFPIIVRDFKPSNILLDDQLNAKLSDFGCARLGPSDEDTHVTTGVSGTFAYRAPEYTATGYLRTSSDVWSYGVFLYVLITGKPPLNPNLPKNEQSLVGWVKRCLEDEKFGQIVDSRIEGDITLQSAKGLLTIADECLHKNHEDRPKMSYVLHLLHQLMMESSLETIPSLVPILEHKGQKVSHEQQTSTTVQIQGKRRFVCLPQLCP